MIWGERDTKNPWGPGDKCSGSPSGCPPREAYWRRWHFSQVSKDSGWAMKREEGTHRRMWKEEEGGQWGPWRV